MLHDFRYALPQFEPDASIHHRGGALAGPRDRRQLGHFTIADQVLLRLVPVRHARDLVFFTSPGPQDGLVWCENMFSYQCSRTSATTTRYSMESPPGLRLH
jgi:hypothetical protein